MSKVSVSLPDQICMELRVAMELLWPGTLIQLRMHALSSVFDFKYP